MRSSVASPAAIATGLPAMVEPWLPAGHVMISFLAIIAPSGIPEAIPLAAARCRERRRCARREHLAGAAHAALDLVEHQHDSVRSAIARS
jgi:hypothetical protein